MKMDASCLTLNIFAPQMKRNHTAPVYVLLHDGMNIHGNSADFGVNGLVRNFVDRGILVVTVNYRIGVYGK